MGVNQKNFHLSEHGPEFGLISGPAVKFGPKIWVEMKNRGLKISGILAVWTY